MNLKRVRSLVVCVLPLSLPLFAACNTTADSTEDGDASIGVAAQAAIISAPAVAISGGDKGSLALMSDETVWAWGDNTEGQLGDGTTTARSTPVQVSGLASVAAIADGWSSYSMARKSDGSLWAWGAGTWGQLGNGSSGDQHTPVQVENLSGVTAMAAAYLHGIAVTTDGVTAAGSVWSWGINASGHLGVGSTAYSLNAPARVLKEDDSWLTGATAVAGGNGFSLAVSGGAVYAWGRNDEGQLGNGSTTDEGKAVLVHMPSGLTATAVAAGYRSSLARTSNGRVWAWGGNTHGQLGNDSTTASSEPVNVQVEIGGVTGPLWDISAVAEGYQFSLALKSDGTVWGWGSNGAGQLGDGTNVDRHTAVKVLLPAGVVVTSIAAGKQHGLARTSDGKVFAWGGNDDGQLCDGTTTDRRRPALACPSRAMPNTSTGLPHPTSYTSMTGSVLDDVTGLQWEQPISGCTGGCSQSDANAYCEGLTLGGHSDWRLPTRIELISIVDDTEHAPAIDPSAFSGSSNSYFWASTPMTGISGNAFAVGGAEGDTSYRTGSVDKVRCVRATASAPAGSYLIEAGGTSTGTVLDTGTGLTWQQAAPSGTYTSANAASYCGNNTAGLPGTGWRLPSMKELQTIVDDSRTSPAIDPSAFPSTSYDAPFWSSTAVAWQTGYAWYVRFDVGASNHAATSTMHRVRCVR